MIITCMIITSALVLAATAAVPRVINVVKLGAIADGETDATLPFHSAWASACSSTKPATIYVPVGRYFLRSGYFHGEKCKNKGVHFVIDGTLVAPDYRNTSTNNSWIRFDKVIGVSISGGNLDGRGDSLWACKRSSGHDCPPGAPNLEFTNSRNIVITKVTSINSQKFHMIIKDCQYVELQGITISAPGNSPNTDGIHIEFSTGITVINSRISTGDDCVSIGPGSSNLWIESISCGPGHGVSIGSLGWTVQEAGVKNVTVKTATFTSTENGVRIKTWARESNGFVKGVVFEDLTMVNVDHPVIIDQNYCPHEERNCPKQVAGVTISDVRYEDIRGTSANHIGVKLDCSKEHPCIGIKMDDVKLSYKNGPAQIYCVNAHGNASDSGSAVVHHIMASPSPSCFLED
uniref:polygalacturonase-like n=1 Tax=Erigeron canadensis TaxID=72917 RepID=UPI001CB9D05F|nr:polygalacturonase-like [Erigeron canadensis]